MGDGPKGREVGRVWVAHGGPGQTLVGLWYSPGSHGGQRAWTPLCSVGVEVGCFQIAPQIPSPGPRQDPQCFVKLLGPREEAHSPTPPHPRLVVAMADSKKKERGWGAAINFLLQMASKKGKSNFPK